MVLYELIHDPKVKIEIKENVYKNKKRILFLIQCNILDISFLVKYTYFKDETFPKTCCEMIISEKI